MPIYEFECKKCNIKIEKLRKINDNSIVTCPKCNSICKKIISNSNFILKGSGWSNDNYSKK